MNFVSAIAVPADGFVALAPVAGIVLEGSLDCWAAKPQIAKIPMNAATNEILNVADI
jgi:hypothetical protein